MDRRRPRRRNRAAGGPSARLTDALEGSAVLVTAARAGWATHVDPLIIIAGTAGALELEQRRPRLAWSLRIAAARVIMADMEAARDASSAPSIEGAYSDDDELEVR